MQQALLVTRMAGPPTIQSDSAFLRLPREIRSKIFKHTDLVDLRQSSHEDHAILYEGGGVLKPAHHPIRKGKVAGQSCTSAIACSWPLSRALFLVNKQIYREAQESFFEHHRFVLAAGHDANLKWLQSLPDNCRKRIRRLHVRFKAERHDLYEEFELCQDDYDSEFIAIMTKIDNIDNDDFESPQNYDPHCCLLCNISGWDTFLAYLSAQLNLAKLHLAVDLGQIYSQQGGIYQYHPLSVAVTQRAMRRVSQPLVTQLRGRVKSLFVFLHECFDLESEIEKSVMGEDYNAAQYGKIPPESRCYWRPYAIPNSDSGRLFPPDRRKSWQIRHNPRPSLWGMIDGAHGVIRMEWADDFDRGYSARGLLDEWQENCTKKEICREEIELLLKFQALTGEIIVKRF